MYYLASGAVMDLPNMSTEISAAVSFVVGGGLVAFIKSVYDYSQTVKRDQLAFDQQELIKYKDKTLTLEQRVVSLESSQIQSSVPEWRKDCSGRYDFVNLAYELYVLLPLNKARSDIIGRTDAEIFAEWPEFVAIIQSLDREAVVSARKFAIRRNVIFPKAEGNVMLIKEVAQSFDGRIVLIGRSYPETNL